jgi:hypothetical protein
MADEATPITAAYAERERRSVYYFDKTLAGQRQWYSCKGASYKRRGELLGLFIIAAGALTAFIPAFGASPAVGILTGALGALIAIVEGWQRIARYAEGWMAYRVASEKMKREQRLYLTGAGPYRTVAGEDDAFLLFVEAIEAIIAEEQQIYWRERTTASGPAAPTVTGAGRAGQADMQPGEAVATATSTPASSALSS